MAKKSLKTYVTDTFPLDQMECQYFDICRDYKPSDQVKGKIECVNLTIHVN